MIAYAGKGVASETLWYISGGGLAMIVTTYPFQVISGEVTLFCCIVNWIELVSFAATSFSVYVVNDSFKKIHINYFDSSIKYLYILIWPKNINATNGLAMSL